MARERIHFQGLPARICWVGLGQRHRLGLAFNDMVRSGELEAPVVIGRDHLDSGSVASPNRETEAMRDGSDAVSDWPLLNALLSTASGATWVSLHHGGGVGMGYSQHAGLVICCDGSPAGGRPDRPRAVERSGVRGHAARRRGIRRSYGMRPRARARPAEPGRLSPGACHRSQRSFMAVRVPKEILERDPAVIAPLAGLEHYPDHQPGWRRRRRGRGFTYVDAGGRTVRGDQRRRIEALGIPPAWRDVWISPRPHGHLQASGTDQARRKQYRYHDSFRELCEARKFARLAYFGRALILLRKAADSGLAEPIGTRDHATAAAVRLIDACLLRVGNRRSAEEGRYGATTLTVDHVEDDGFVELEYHAKGGKLRTVVVEDDDLADVLTTLADGAGENLFWFLDPTADERRRVTASDVNRFIAEHAGPAFSAKDFRTWGGSRLALEARVDGGDAIEAVDEAAQALGNTRTVARASYVHPRVLQASSEQLRAIWRRSRSSRWADRGDSALRKLLA